MKERTIEELIKEMSKENLVLGNILNDFVIEFSKKLEKLSNGGIKS